MNSFALSSLLVISICLLRIPDSFAGRHLSQAAEEQSMLYHNGPLLSGKVSVNLIWYGNFKPSQKAIVVDFIASLSSSENKASPSVATWWNSIHLHYNKVGRRESLSLYLGKQISDEGYSLGKSLTDGQIEMLAARGGQEYAINVVLTSADVVVERFCLSRCGSHGSAFSAVKPTIGRKSTKFAFIWVGNAETQCPGYCAWPFHQPVYGPQGPPLMAPNGDVGLDGMIINLGTLLAGTVTNPFGNGFYQGPKEAPLEAASACTGVYGKGAYPGYAGDLLVDAVTGASYNANGNDGRKYLLPALYDPSTATCSTLI